MCVGSGSKSMQYWTPFKYGFKKYFKKKGDSELIWNMHVKLRYNTCGVFHVVYCAPKQCAWMDNG